MSEQRLALLELIDKIEHMGQFQDRIDFPATIGQITLVEWLVLIALAAVRLIPEAWIYQAALPGISFGRSMTTFLVTASLNNVPPGGLDLVARYQMARSWGVSVTGASTATPCGRPGPAITIGTWISGW